MKFLVVLIFAGIAFASAVPLQQNKFELDRRVDDFASGDVFEAEKESTFDEVKDQLEDRVKEILKKIKEVIDTGKLFQKDTLLKLKELNEKLRRELGEEGFKKLRDNTAGLLRKLLENFGFHKRAADEHAEDIMAEAEHADLSDIIKMKEVLEELITKAKDAFDNGGTVTEYLEKIQQIRAALKLLNIDLGEKAREYLQVLKDKVRDYWNKLKQKLTTKRSADIDVFGMFEELKKLIREKFDLSKVKEYIEKVFGKRSEVRETLLNWLKDKGGKQKILDFIEKILGEKESYGVINDYYQKVKNYFKDLNIELHEKYAEFGHWVKEQYEENIEKGKDKAESLKLIAREFLHDSRMLSKHMAVEAKFFFTEYSNELGDMFGDVMKKIENVLKD